MLLVNYKTCARRLKHGQPALYRSIINSTMGTAMFKPSGGATAKTCMTLVYYGTIMRKAYRT